MIIDATGIELTPGDNGENCLGNGLHFDANGNPIECCCDECDYMLCCMDGQCAACKHDYPCPKDM